MRSMSLVVLLFALVAVATAVAAEHVAPVAFTKHVIDAKLPAISATTADVDGDGRLDVIAAGGPAGGPSEWSNLVYWYRAPDWQKTLLCKLDPKAIILHIEAVNFSAKTDAQPRPVEITIADGALGNVWWYLYDRDKQQWRGGIIVKDVVGVHGTAAGDIDADGYADLLVPTQQGTPKNGIIWCRNPGPGKNKTLWPRQPVTENLLIPGWQEYVRLADLNGDGKLDALHGSDAADGWFGFWLQGKDPRSPWQAHPLAGAIHHATNLDAADLNGDGKLDLVGSEGHGLGLWYFPAPDYKPRHLDETLKSAHCLALGDFDGDGRIDLASCGYESKMVAVFLNRGDGTFERIVIDRDQCAYDADAVDLDADGDLDIVLAGQNSGNLVWYENQQR